MNIHNKTGVADGAGAAKFTDPLVTARGEPRAHVALQGLETLWFNTGTLCNLECGHCYIESSPLNDRLAYLTHDEMLSYLDEIREGGLPTREIGFTGGEPFMNPDMYPMLESCLARGFQVLVLTNAMRPMMRGRDQLAALNARYGGQLGLRVSIDHYTRDVHEQERGARSWDAVISGLKWLSDNGFHFSVAGRHFTAETGAELRAGFAELFDLENIRLDANDPAALVLFPEMDAAADVPEITTGCWKILDVEPASVMCASSRMVVRRKGAEHPVVLACTLIPYDDRFEMGKTLADARLPVSLNHPHCAKFCVLGGASCSG